jgi:hypothetical protein
MLVIVICIVFSIVLSIILFILLLLILLLLVLLIVILLDVLQGVNVIWFTAEYKLVLGRVLRPVTCITLVIMHGSHHKDRKFRHGLQGFEEVTIPHRRKKFRSRISSNFVIYFAKCDLIYHIVSGERWIEFVMNHPFYRVLEMFERLFMGMSGQLEGNSFETICTEKIIIIHARIVLVCICPQRSSYSFRCRFFVFFAGFIFAPLLMITT